MVQWPYLEGMAEKCNNILLTYLGALSTKSFIQTQTTAVIMSLITPKCSSMYSRYTFVYRARAGETRLRKHQVAWTTQRQVRCTRGLHSAALWKAAERVSNNEGRRRRSGIAGAVVVKSIQHRCEIGNSSAPKIPPARNRMNHQKGFPSDSPLLSACAAIAIFSHRGIVWVFLLHPKSSQWPRPVILSPLFCSHVVPLLRPHWHCAISGSQNICTWQL